MIRNSLLALALIAAAPMPTLAGPTATLSLRFENVKAHQGRVMIAVYDEAGWNGGAPVRVAMADATAADVTAALTGLAPGRYGVKVFLDADGDGKMGTNPFGMPIEQFGFSHDAMGAGAPPAFGDAAIVLTAGNNAQTITLR